MNVLVFLYLYYKYNNSQTIIYNVTIIFKIEQLPINYECIMLLQIKVNIRADTHGSCVLLLNMRVQHNTKHQHQICLIILTKRVVTLAMTCLPYKIMGKIIPFWFAVQDNLFFLSSLLSKVSFIYLYREH